MHLDVPDTNSKFSATIEGATVNFDTPLEKFEALSDAWSDETPGTSILNYNSFCYHQIIGMGVQIIPILLERLRQGEGQWVHALSCIVGQQVHTPGMVGNPDRVIEAWLKWGDSRGGGNGRIAG